MTPSVSPWNHLRGEVLAYRGETRAARKTQKRTQELAQDGWERDWLRGREAARAGRFEEAVEAYRSLADLPGEEPFIGFYLAVRLACGHALLRADRPAEALREFIELRLRSPQSLLAGVLEGKAWHRLGNPDQARRVLERVHTASPDRDWMAYRIAKMYFFGLREEEEGLFWCKKIETEYARERARCHLLFHVERMREAERAGRRAVALKQDDREAILWLVRSLNHQGKLDEAGDVLEQGLKALPQDPVLHQELAAVYRSQERFDHAISAARRATELDPGYALAHSVLGSSLFQAGRVEEAFEAHRTATDLGRAYFGSHNAAGVDFHKSGRLDDALEAFDRAIEIAPNIAWSHSNKARALERRGDLSAAKAAYREAGTAYLGGVGAHVELGRVLEAEGDCRSALSQFLKALEVTPSHAETHCRIVRMLRNPRSELAEDDWNRLSQVLEEAASREESPWIWNTLAELSISRPGQRDAKRALERLLRALRSESSDRGSVTSAVLRTLDGLLPFLTTDGELRAPLRSEVEDESTRSWISFLEARSLERSGRYHDAAHRLLEARPDPLWSPEFLFARVRNLRAAGESRLAEKALREALEGELREDQDAWTLWAAVSLAELSKTPSRLLAELDESGFDAFSAPPMPLRRHLRTLAEGKPLRINCGGGQLNGAEDQQWSEDSFFLGGRASSPWKGDFPREARDSLYHSSRYFESPAGSRGYRIPVPPGRYRVTLHFSNTSFWPPGCWRFDVRLEGLRVLQRYEPLSLGALETDRRVFEKVTVNDGALDLLFEPDCGTPCVAAIEIEAS